MRQKLGVTYRAGNSIKHWKGLYWYLARIDMAVKEAGASGVSLSLLGNINEEEGFMAFTVNMEPGKRY